MTSITFLGGGVFSELPSSSGVDTGILPVAIDGREFLVDLTTGRYRRSNVDVLRTRTNSGANENLLLEPEVWRTVRQTLHEGAGQSERDRADSSDARFHASKNIDPWEMWRLTLLHGTELVTSDTSSDLLCISVNSGVVTIGGTTLSYYTDFGSAPSTVTLPSAAVAHATDGQTVYIGHANGDVTAVTTPGLSASTFVTLPSAPDMLAYMKGMLVAGTGPDLYDISSGLATANELFFSHPLADHTWVAGTDGLAAGYLLGGQGSKWMVYWVGVLDDASTFKPPVVAAPLPDGEVGYGLGSYLGNVLIGTSLGVRFAAPSGDNTLVYGRLIRTNAPVTSFEGEDRFVWFGIGGAAARDLRYPLVQPEAGLARLDLATFTSELTPAFAADLVAVSDPSGTATSVAALDGRLAFVLPGTGLYAETDEYASEGWIMDGNITFNVQDAKVGLYMNMVTEPLQGEIEVQATYDGGDTPTVLFQLAGQGAVTSGNHYIGRQFRSIETTAYLRPSADGMGAPVITYAEIRALPAIGSAHQWEIPLVVTSGSNWENSRKSHNIRDELDSILQLVETGRVFDFREGTRKERCFATKYEWFPTSMVEDEGMWQGVCVLTIRSIR